MFTVRYLNNGKTVCAKGQFTLRGGFDKWIPSGENRSVFPMVTIENMYFTFGGIQFKMAA